MHKSELYNSGTKGCTNPDEARDTEPPNSAESSLPVEVALPSI